MLKVRDQGSDESITLSFVEHLGKVEMSIADKSNSCSTLVDEETAELIVTYLKNVYNI